MVDVQRLVLPQHLHLAAGDVEERHRRDGFELGNADRIFESTTLASKEVRRRGGGGCGGGGGGGGGAPASHGGS